MGDASANLAEHCRGQFVSTVEQNLPLCREHHRLVLRLPAFPPTAPGVFVQVACRDVAYAYGPEREVDWRPGDQFDVEGRELLSPLALLRRPFSLAGRRDLPGGRGVELDLIHRVVGFGTDWLARLRPGDEVSLIGPLGNRFSLPPDGDVALLVGGGVGIPPMLYLAEALAGRPAVAFCGAVSRDLLPLTITADAPPARQPAGPPSGPDPGGPRHNIAEFARHGIPAVVTTDDGSYGVHGLVTVALERHLARHFPDTWAVGSVRPTLYTCGPEGMMRRVAEIALARGLECQVAVERAMACGMGTCQSCCIRVKAPDAPEGWRYRLACTDGPVFRGAELLW